MAMLDNTLRIIRKAIPGPIYNFLQPIYHWKLSLIAAILYGFPSRKIKVIAVSGTKGKSSTTEILNAILEEAGFKTAVSNTIRFKIGDRSQENLFKMSMPGRFFSQHFIRDAVDQKCDFVIMEMTSQGALLYRHRFIELDAFVLTNVSPEHIEAHGSYENYVRSKIAIVENMRRSGKQNRTIIVNGDDHESSKFLSCEADKKVSFSLREIEPYKVLPDGLDFTLNGKRVHSPLSGLFNLYNILAAITAARSQGVSDEIIIRAVEKFDHIAGRVQKIEAGQAFKVIVDYAHTTDSLEKLYKVFDGSKKICVLGGTGGGRDTWKRSEMGRIADQYCSQIILTDEDPYDEDPKQIVEHVAQGITNHTPKIVMERREAIREAIQQAKPGDVVLITGKGTDPYIMGPNGTKKPWSDAMIAKEEILDLKNSS